MCSCTIPFIFPGRSMSSICPKNHSLRISGAIAGVAYDGYLHACDVRFEELGGASLLTAKTVNGSFRVTAPADNAITAAYIIPATVEVQVCAQSLQSEHMFNDKYCRDLLPALHCRAAV
jgi:hypothetical protein